jgi:outer membrane lipoprotein carrier protein
MKSVISVILFLCTAGFLSAQKDNEGVKILDKFSSNAMQAPSVTMKFKLVTSNLTDNKKDTVAGSVIILKDKYKLDLPDNIIWFNGETSWSYLPAEKEVTIAKADRKDNSFQSKPSQIFTMYKKGYKARLIEEKADSYIIDLYPDDLKGDLMRIRLSIGKSLMNLISLEYRKKDGTIVTLFVSDFNLKNKPDNETFIFREANYKGVEVIDMR